jgi:ring-1,2-phenylacetyl-CoA epoxidase subunit PaaC
MAHATDWVIRLGDGTADSHSRVQTALDDVWMYTGEMFETDEVDAILQDKNIAVDIATIKEKWNAHLDKVLKEATLIRPQDGYMQTGGRNGLHAEYLGHILSEMQYLQRAYPDAKW